MSEGRARAEACANIALAKYWGKSERGDNLTAVPSLSLTLNALRTRTEVTVESTLTDDVVSMNGQVVTGASKERVTELLGRIRSLTGDARYASVQSLNNFPTAAGLASSASGFAALAVAADSAYGAQLTRAQLSSQARKSSASAARSLFSGFALLEAEADEGEALHAEDFWDVAMVVAVISSSKKSIGSTGGMVHTRDTSPYYPAWVARSKEVYARLKEGVNARDFTEVAEAMEHSTRMMHATMMTAEPPVLYLRGATVDLMHEVAARRRAGEPVAYTMDAGPNVKVFTLGSHVDSVRAFLSDAPGVESVIVCRPGPGASTLLLEGSLADAQRSDKRPVHFPFQTAERP